MGGTSYAHPVIFRWLDHVLCGKPMPSGPDARAADKLIATFADFGGPEAGAQARALLEVAPLV